MTSTACTCQEQIRIENRRKELRRIWQSEEWRQARDDFRARHPPVCSRCGREEKIYPGHSSEDYHPDMILSYIEKVKKDECEPICSHCNRHESKGKKPCPGCVEKHKADPSHRISYIYQNEETCAICKNGHAKRKIRPRHPCARRVGNQRCQRNGRVYICAVSSKHAKECDHFQEREMKK